MRAISALSLALLCGALTVPAHAADPAQELAEAKALYLEAFSQRTLNPEVARAKLERVITATAEAHDLHRKAALLLQEMDAKTRQEELETRIRTRAKELYLEAYTQQKLSPSTAMAKLEWVVDRTDPDFAYHRKAVELLEVMRRPPPPRVSSGHGNRPRLPPPAELYEGPVITAGEAFARGKEMMRKRRHAEAIPFFWHAIELDPEGQAVAHKFLGIAHARTGAKCGAARHYQRYIEVVPDARDAPKVRQILEMFWHSERASGECEGR